MSAFVGEEDLVVYISRDNYVYEHIVEDNKLRKVPLYDFSKATDISWLFYGCPLEEVPPFSFPNVTSIGSGADFGNIAAKMMPAWPLNPKLSYFSIGANNLRCIPAFDFSLCTQVSAYFSAPYATRSLVHGFRRSHTYSSYSFSREALVEIFTNLGVALEGATITISGIPYGIADLTAEDLAIATSKGWTVAY